MDPGRWERVDRIFQQALSLPPDCHVSFLDEACAGDADLRREVESLLRHEQQAGSFIAEPAYRAAADDEPRRPSSDLLGRSLLHYRIVEKIGEGGMGTVYRAHDSHLNRPVAVKVLPPERMADPERRKRLIREARAASALNHPGIVTIHDISSAEGIDFIAMEFVSGTTLAESIGRRGLPVPEVLKYGIQIADALDSAHRAGILHRDLKPANIMLTERGMVKVLDFGLAKLTEAQSRDGQDLTRSTESMTQSGAIVGTSAYMSPEQAQGKPVDARSDIFSFGSLLYEMATGTRAFEGPSTAETLAAVIRAQPTPPGELAPALPRELERLIGRALHKEPDRRYQTMRDVSLELQWIKEEPDSERLSTQVPARTESRRARWIPAVVVAAVTLVGAIAFMLWLQKRGWSDAPPQRLVSLTALNGLESQPTFSPDGEQVAFVWDGERQDNHDIYLKLVGSSELRRLTTDALPDGNPAWSPDGREIAFLRFGRDGTAVYEVSPITGAERKILDLGTGYWVGLSWSPDARWLAIGRIIPGRGGGIYLLPVHGGDLRTLTTTQHPSSPGYPSFSPDGRALAFRRCSGALRCSLDVLVLDAGLTPVGRARTVAPVRGGEGSWAAAWTRDGRSLIYESGGYLWRVSIVGASAPERLELAGHGALMPALAAHRDRLAFVSQRSTTSYHPLDTNYTSPPVLASSYGDNDVSFSPDGQRIVFNSLRAGEGPEIWKARADGTGARQLVRGPGNWQGSPSFSPDGRQVAFDSRQEDGSWSIFVVDADGGVPRPVTTDPGDENIPVWSPDGRWIFYTSDQKAGRNVWRIPAAGGRSEQLTTAGSDYRVRVSPDGRELLYTPPLEKGQAPLVAVPVAGGASRRLLPCVRSFSTSSVGVYYIECGPGPDRNVHMIDAATARDSVIGRTRDTPYQPSVVAVSPDGRSLLVPRGEWTRDLMLIENFR